MADFQKSIVTVCLTFSHHPGKETTSFCRSKISLECQHNPLDATTLAL